MGRAITCERPRFFADGDQGEATCESTADSRALMSARHLPTFQVGSTITSEPHVPANFTAEFHGESGIRSCSCAKVDCQYVVALRSGLTSLQLLLPFTGWCCRLSPGQPRAQQSCLHPICRTCTAKHLRHRWAARFGGYAQVNAANLTAQ